jgi:hypothetical protein
MYLHPESPLRNGRDRGRAKQDIRSPSACARSVSGKEIVNLNGGYMEASSARPTAGSGRQLPPTCTRLTLPG